MRRRERRRTRRDAATLRTATPTEVRIVAHPGARRLLRRSPSARLALVAGSRVRAPLGAIAVWVGLLAAIGILCLAYSMAGQSTGGTMYFNVFWLGLAAFLVPTVLRLTSDAPSREERVALVVGTALTIFLPKILRHPDGPLYADELAHWRQTEVIGRTNELFQPNPFISVVDSFPGLHALSVVVRDLAGITTWQTAVVLVGLFMTMTLLGVFVLVEHFTRSSRAASFAALIYACCPSFSFFDAQYGYESMALPLLVWILVAAAKVQDDGSPFKRRAAWLVVGALLVLGLVITHHLTSIVMIGVLGMIAFIEVVYLALRRERLVVALPIIALSFFAVAAGAVWVFGIADDVGSYLAPHLTGGFDELRGIMERKQGGRQLFAQSTAPFYERRMAFVAPAIIGVVAVVGLWRVRSMPRIRPMLLTLVGLGLVYFPSVPFMLTAAGAEGARRSWAFTYLGVALLGAIGVGVVLDRVRRQRRPWIARLALAGMVMALLVGNVASGLSVEYRFPGPAVFGSDTRSLTTELVAAQEWFTETQGTGNRLVADRSSGLAFGQLGLNWTERSWSGFPLWDFYFKPERPDPAVLRSMELLGTGYLIVDKRIPLLLPRTGVYLVKDEPGGKAHVTPPPAAAIEKYQRTPWTIKIFESDSYEVYRLDYDALDECGDQTPEPGARFAKCR